MTKCNFNNCEKESEFAVIFEFRATKDGVVAPTTPVLVLCGDHIDIQWKDVFHQESFDKLCELFKSSGKMPPKVEYSNIAIIPIKELPPDIAKMYNEIKSRG